ncbi:MAG: FAD-dependent oxidoreductase [Pseudomonadota bacterium]
MKQSYDVLIIGGGPAGCMAAMHLAARHWTTLLVDKETEQGYLASLKMLGNFPGFPDEINGAEIIDRLRKQAQKAGAFIKHLEINKINFEEEKKIAEGGEQQFEVKSVILATGAAGRTGHLPGGREFFGQGVSHDVQTDVSLTQDKEVAIVGKNKTAAEAAILLSKYARQVHFIIPSNKLDIENRLVNDLQNNKKVHLLFSASLKSITGNKHVENVTLFVAGQEKSLPVNYIFNYQHEYQVSNQFLKQALKLEEKDNIPIDEKFQTPVPGVFACGDVICGRPQQPLVSTTQGLLAAMNVDDYLRTLSKSATN